MELIIAGAITMVAIVAIWAIRNQNKIDKDALNALIEKLKVDLREANNEVLMQSSTLEGANEKLEIAMTENKILAVENDELLEFRDQDNTTIYNLRQELKKYENPEDMDVSGAEEIKAEPKTEATTAVDPAPVAEAKPKRTRRSSKKPVKAIKG